MAPFVKNGAITAPFVSVDNYPESMAVERVSRETRSDRKERRQKRS